MKPLRLFLLLAFILFFAGFALVGLLISIGSPDYLVVIVQIAMAWTPTAAVAVIHRRINPEVSFIHYVRDQFTERIRVLPLLMSILIPVITTLIVWIGYSAFSGIPLSDLLVNLSATAILIMFGDSLIRGPLGEELGWRGYLLIELKKRFSLLGASLIVGVIWSLWHFPLWFITGFQGIDLLLYIGFFVIGLTSFSIIIGFICRGRRGNLIYAILLHQMLNFAGRLIDIDELTVLGASSLIYFLTASAISLISLISRHDAAVSQ